jgi:hypothetical protein
MTVDAWRAAVAADRPPFTPEQITILRPICAQMLPHMGNAAPACTSEAASHRNARTTTTPATGVINAPR